MLSPVAVAAGRTEVRKHIAEHMQSGMMFSFTVARA
jgi:hypothetical protein